MYLDGCPCFLPWVPGGSTAVCHDCYRNMKVYVSCQDHYCKTIRLVCKSNMLDLNLKISNVHPLERVSELICRINDTQFLSKDAQLRR